jgi:hypothetical protein
MASRATDGPHLFRVTISNELGQPMRWIIQTWYGPHKAVAIATQAHQALAPDWYLYTVDVEDLGTEPPAEGFEDRRLFDDRMEW